MADNEAETEDLDAQFARGYARTSGTNLTTSAASKAEKKKGAETASVAPVSDGGGEGHGGKVAAEEAGFGFPTLGDAAEAGGSGADAADAQEPGIGGIFFPLLVFCTLLKFL